MKSNLYYTLGILLGIAVCVSGILMGFPIWAITVATIAIITVFAVLGESLAKKSSLANDPGLARLIAKSIRLRTTKDDTSDLEKKIAGACAGNPEAWKGYKALGELFLARENRSMAKEYFMKADGEMTVNDRSQDRCLIWNTIGGIAMAQGRNEEALEYFMKAASVDSSFYRGPGLMYEFGWGVGLDLLKAEQLMTYSVVAGNSFAIPNLYEIKWRRDRNDSRDKWQGYADYMYGCHCGRTPVSGASSLRESARNGYAPAQFELGVMYQSGQYGEDMPTKRREAFKWLKASADQGFLPGVHNLGLLVQQGIFDPEKGDIYTPSVKGTMLYDKEIIRHCAVEGHKLLLSAAQAGYAPSQHSVGMRYILGSDDATGTQDYKLFEKDSDKALVWLRRAADQGFKAAKEDLDKYFGSRA